jgi:hypothetical protein
VRRVSRSCAVAAFAPPRSLDATLPTACRIDGITGASASRIYRRFLGWLNATS